MPERGQKNVFGFFRDEMILLGVLGGILLTLALLNIHCFNVECMSASTEFKAGKYNLSGTARPIRSDEWLVLLPLYFSQTSDGVKFSSWNRLIGSGKNTQVGFPVPNLSVYTFFRPFFWGYFLGPNFGMAWHWNFRLLLFVFAAALFFRRASGLTLWASLIPAIGFVFSPFFVFWTYDREPMVSLALLCTVLTWNLLEHRNRKEALISAGLLSYFLVSFCFSTIYPAWQIPSLIAFVLLVMPAVLVRWRQLLTEDRLSLGLLVVPGLICLVLLTYYYYSNQREIALVMNTVYPGQRFELGGNATLDTLFGGNLNLHWARVDWQKYGNVCEGSGFFLMVPFLLPFFIQAFMQNRLFSTRDPEVTQDVLTILLLLLFIVMYIDFALFGLPRLVAKISLFSNIPPKRGKIILGICQFVILPFLIKHHRRIVQKDAGALASVTTLCVMLIFMVYSQLAGSPIVTRLSDVGFSLIVAIFLLVLFVYKPYVSVVFLAILSITSSAGFLPLVRGGFEAYTDNDASRLIREDQAENPSKELRYVVFNSIGAENLPRVLGVNSVNGLHFYPDPQIWKILDPSDQFKTVWNRHAHVVFQLGNQDDIQMSVNSPDSFTVRISPDHPRFLELKVNRFLILCGNESQCKKELVHWRYKENHGNYALYLLREGEPTTPRNSL